MAEPIEKGCVRIHVLNDAPLDDIHYLMPEAPSRDPVWTVEVGLLALGLLDYGTNKLLEARSASEVAAMWSHEAELVALGWMWTAPGAMLCRHYSLGDDALDGGDASFLTTKEEV